MKRKLEILDVSWGMARLHPRRVRFIDYHLPPGGDVYEEKEVGETGRIWLDEVNLWLGFESGKLACYDTTGNRIGNYVEVTQALAEAEKKAADETRARAKAERLTAKETKARAEAERRVEDLAKSAKEWEDRFLAMEEELRRVRGEKNEGN